MISHNTSISSFGKRKSLIKEKDYELIHYFDDQSDTESDPQNERGENENDSNTNSDNDSKEENYFEYDKDSEYDLNEKVIAKSPDGNYGKVCNNYINIIYF